MTTTTEFTEKMQTAFKDASEKAKAALEKSQASFGELGEFAKGNVEALVESTKILSTGLQELGKGRTLLKQIGTVTDLAGQLGAEMKVRRHLLGPARQGGRRRTGVEGGVALDGIEHLAVGRQARRCRHVRGIQRATPGGLAPRGAAEKIRQHQA